jgi:hypothetical protein
MLTITASVGSAVKAAKLSSVRGYLARFEKLLTTEEGRLTIAIKSAWLTGGTITLVAARCGVEELCPIGLTRTCLQCLNLKRVRNSKAGVSQPNNCQAQPSCDEG